MVSLAVVSTAVLVVAVALFSYTYVVYPTVLAAVGRFRSIDPPTAGPPYPSVALVVAAYNEEDVIARKIENSLELEYPGALDVVVFSDASSDDTDRIVRSFEPAVELVRIEGRVGKTECQNRIVERVDADVVVFSDANSMYVPDAVRRLVDRMATGVDCVIGELRYDGGGVEEESLYWRLDRAIKRGEAAAGNAVIGNGAIYAVRRSAYVPLASDEISDFAEPLAILSRGGTVKYGPEAYATERTGESIAVELDRRIRITTRSWHTLVRYRELLNPVRHPGVAVKLVSHKLLRWLSPLLIAVIAIATTATALTTGSLLVGGFLALQAVCYLLAGVGWAIDRRGGARPGAVVTVPYYFLTVNYGLAVGLWNFLRGRNIVAWETESRTDEV